MKKYKLFHYSLHDEGGLLNEGTDSEKLANEAIEFTSFTNQTCRLETWLDEKMIGEWRFFFNGDEITKNIKKSILGTSK